EKALIEMAKIKTEDQKYHRAVEYYRKHTILYNDRKCNNFFMTGFIFDEYLNSPKKAEMNYKWILKNTPDCELADDAEFMCLHLDEPTPGVETLHSTLPNLPFTASSPANRSSGFTLNTKRNKNSKR
ncbi:MAG: hypothetical protein R6V59_00460, partial [Dehalococcoidia bacterium]